MADIKSAREIAMEKLAKLEDATEEERLEWKLIPRGQEIAARYIKEDVNLLAELGAYSDRERKYVVRGASEVLARNISLPKNDAARRLNKRIMDGFKLLKTDKARVENVYSRVRQIFTHYTEQGEQQRKQVYEQLKQQFEARLQQAAQQQMGSMLRMRVDVERHPQFREEWRRAQIELDAPYLQHLDEYRRELVSMP